MLFEFIASIFIFILGAAIGGLLVFGYFRRYVIPHESNDRTSQYDYDQEGYAAPDDPDDDSKF